tara:strand:+ start:553 stop:1065 length:513 start_codon:yes stop_codon:yes gene_type:complete
MSISLHLSESEAQWILELVRESNRWLENNGHGCDASEHAHNIDNRLSHELQSIWSRRVDPNTWQALHHSFGDLSKASVALPNGQPAKVHVEIGPHVEFVHMRARGQWWLYATPDFEESGTIAFCLEHEETTDIPIAFDVAVTWTGDLEIDLETYSEETTKALSKALKSID